jgi:uncharacterized membrane protein
MAQLMRNFIITAVFLIISGVVSWTVYYFIGHHIALIWLIIAFALLITNAKPKFGKKDVSDKK